MLTVLLVLHFLGLAISIGNGENESSFDGDDDEVTQSGNPKFVRSGSIRGVELNSKSDDIGEEIKGMRVLDEIDGIIKKFEDFRNIGPKVTKNKNVQ